MLPHNCTKRLSTCVNGPGNVFRTQLTRRAGYNMTYQLTTILRRGTLGQQASSYTKRSLNTFFIGVRIFAAALSKVSLCYCSQTSFISLLDEGKFEKNKKQKPMSYEADLHFSGWICQWFVNFWRHYFPHTMENQIFPYHFHVQPSLIYTHSDQNYYYDCQTIE